MKKGLFLVLILVISLVGCETRDKSDDIKKEYMSTLIKELDKGELNSYIEGKINLISAEPHVVKSMQFYEFVLKAKLNKEFSNLTDEQKYDLFKELDNAFLNNFCGKNSNCSIDSFTFKDARDT